MNLGSQPLWRRAVPQRQSFHWIMLDHLNVRQSISFLLLKLIIVDVFFAAGAIFFHGTVGNAIFNALPFLSFIRTQLIILFALYKVSLDIFIILQWEYEYYEITPVAVTHKKGLIFKHEEKYIFDQIRTIKLYQSFLGRVLNYGTVSLLDWDQEREANLYLIHNPNKYYKILQSFLPVANEEKEIIREAMFEPEEQLIFGRSPYIN